MLTATHIVFIILTLVLVTLVGMYSMRLVRSSTDFALGGRAAGTSIIGV